VVETLDAVDVMRSRSVNVLARVCLYSYNSESYLYNRAAPCRRGFGGNYRRSSPRPEASSRPPSTSPLIDDDAGRRLGTQSMPGTLDRRHRRDRATPPLDAASLLRAAADLSRSYHEAAATAVDLPVVGPSRSSDDVETGYNDSYYHSSTSVTWVMTARALI